MDSSRQALQTNEKFLNFELLAENRKIFKQIEKRGC